MSVRIRARPVRESVRTAAALTSNGTLRVAVQRAWRVAPGGEWVSAGSVACGIRSTGSRRGEKSRRIRAMPGPKVSRKTPAMERPPRSPICRTTGRSERSRESRPAMVVRAANRQGRKVTVSIAATGSISGRSLRKRSTLPTAWARRVSWTPAASGRSRRLKTVISRPVARMMPGTRRMPAP